MAFRIGSAGPSPFGTGAGATSMISSETGPDLGEINTEAIGFQSIAGETRLRITPSWPADAPPPPTASLLTVASHKGLLAAAGPASVIIAGTTSIRHAFSTADLTDGNTIPFTPQLTLNIGTRVSQIAFSADENRLVMSAENGGGLAVYSVQALMEGKTQTEFELSTNGVSLRSMLANPTPEKAELFAVVTTNGELMIANLNNRQFLNSTQGQTLRHGVSCISWSARGKQLVAGLGNGACVQMTPEGEVKAEIPRPGSVIGDQHVASISWLENNLFLVNHTLSSSDPDTNPQYTIHLATRITQPQNSFLFQKFPEPCFAGNTKRSPPYCFIRRLREFPPSLQDLIVVVSTASTDVGMLCRSKAPLASGVPVETVTNVFTTTYPADDARRATLPIPDLNEGSSVGVALDFSSQETVKRPLPGEEIEESPGPLPGLMILNDEGVLSSWWLVYADSIRQNTVYPGLVHGEAQKGPQQSLASQSSKPASSFGQTSFGDRTSVKDNGSSFIAPPANTFGPTSAPASGVSSMFGTSSSLVKPQSPWGTPGSNPAIPPSTVPAFGQHGFASTPTNGGGSQGATFGMVGGIGNRTSPWATSASGLGTTQNSSFGQVGALGIQGKYQLGSGANGNVFGSSNTGGFASFATAPGLAVAAAQSGGESVFAKSTPGASFGTGMETDSSFDETSKKDNETPSGLFSGQSFTLGSTFKGDGTAKNDLPKPDATTSNSFFGGNFRETLGENKANAPALITQEAEMDDSVSGNHESSQGSPMLGDSIAPAPEPELSNLKFPGTIPPLNGGLFGTQAQNSRTPAAVQDSVPAISSFDTPTPVTTTPIETPRKPLEVSRISVEAPKSLQVKSEPEGQPALSEIHKSAPEAPVPPEPTSKASYAAGDSFNSSQSLAEDAPLPPDFIPSKTNSKDPQPPMNETPLPPDDDGDVGLDDDEGSGVDVAQDISPITDPNQSPKITPESSFGASFDKSPVGGIFTKVPRQQPGQGAKNLFGEVSSTSIPSFPPPSKVQESPRSPSPIRILVKDKGMSPRPDNQRSMSAPAHPIKAFAKRKPTPSQSNHEAFSQSSIDRQQRREQESWATPQVQVPMDEEQELSDREDEKVREELETEVEPTKNLDPFLAHQDYVGNVSKPGIPGQVEIVYRDINSMIDTLGLNARSMKAFIKGHKELFQEGGRSREDLELGDWCFFEIDDLGVIESKLFEQLKEGRVTGVQDKVHTCRNLRKDLHKIRSKRHEITHSIQTRSKPQKVEVAPSQALTPEQYTTQQDLREKSLQVQKLIAEAEEGISTLGVLISSFESNDSKSTNAKKPTVEAVTNTIQKMTSMVEKKSLDIDLLESQIKQLRLAPSTPKKPTGRERSPSSTSSPSPTAQKFSPSFAASRSTLSATAKEWDFFYSNYNTKYNDHSSIHKQKQKHKNSHRASNRNSNSPARGSGSGLKTSFRGGSPGKGVMGDGVTDEEVERYRAKFRQRQERNEVFRKVLVDGGPRFTELRK